MLAIPLIFSMASLIGGLSFGLWASGQIESMYSPYATNDDDLGNAFVYSMLSFSLVFCPLCSVIGWHAGRWLIYQRKFIVSPEIRSLPATLLFFGQIFGACAGIATAWLVSDFYLPYAGSFDRGRHVIMISILVASLVMGLIFSFIGLKTGYWIIAKRKAGAASGE